MKGFESLSEFSKTCLRLAISRFPQFEPPLRYPESDHFKWVSEIPWPSGSPHNGIRLSTHKSIYGEEFRIDIGNWHTHYGDYGKTGSFEFLESSLEFLDQFIQEKFVLVMRWLNEEHCTDIIKKPDYQPKQADYLGYPEIWVRSWHGTYDQEWRNETGF